MVALFQVFDNVGHVILNYLDCEDAYPIMCTSYMHQILEKTTLNYTSTLLRDWWLTMCDAEINLKYEEDRTNEYVKYLNSEEFYQDMGEYITPV